MQESGERDRERNYERKLKVYYDDPCLLEQKSLSCLNKRERQRIKPFLVLLSCEPLSPL